MKAIVKASTGDKAVTTKNREVGMLDLREEVKKKIESCGRKWWWFFHN